LASVRPTGPAPTINTSIRPSASPSDRGLGACAAVTEVLPKTISRLVESGNGLDLFVVACPFRKIGFHPSGQARGHAFPRHALGEFYRQDEPPEITK
jgi:hypothetical protein